ncbi:ABC transporter permease [Lentzea sp. CA-135723]|uniref:ABC transporter permease n=1 Tax=Lentzea sp. CA-135723 TaxID=3239950 RepID=UPI003D8BE83E
MNATALPATTSSASASASTSASAEVDSRAAYLGFAFAYVFGHGAALLSKSGLVLMPSWLPIGLLAFGLVVGTAFAMTASLRAQKAATEARRRAEKLVGTAWVTGFAALALAVTGLSTVFDKPELQTVLWPAGSTIVVGLIYIAEGAIRGNALHYNLGTWLMLVAAATLFVPGAGFFGVLAVLGGGAYLVAAFLERRRLALAV